MADKKEVQEAVSMPKNTAAALSYVLGLITGVVFLAIQGKNEYVKFHAIQSIGLSLIWIAGWLFLTVIPVIGWIVMHFWVLLMFVLWLVSIVKAYQGEKFKIPLVGNYIQQVGKQVGL
jgi:uncharacterized membrane protein